MREFLYICLSGMLTALPLRWLQKLGAGIGYVMWLVLCKRRAYSIDAVARHLCLPRPQAQEIAKASFLHSGQSFLEIMYARRVTPRFWAQHITFAQPEIMAGIHAEKRPLLLVGGHIGAWEFAWGYMESFFPHRPKQAVVRLPRDCALASQMVHLRNIGQVKVVPHRQASRSVVACLRQKGVTGFLVDHNCIQSEAIFLPFLGEVTAVNMGPALLALRTKALICPLFILREEHGRFCLHAQKILDTSTVQGTLRERLETVAAWYTQAVEKVVLAHPEQWFWMHKRWKTRPPDSTYKERQ